MQDQAQIIESKYFIDGNSYNCPFCKIRSVPYSIYTSHVFNWNAEKKCFVYFIYCQHCESQSMHLSFTKIWDGGSLIRDEDIDSKIFYSVPTSFFAIDKRIPVVIRELITEAEGCMKMNFLTGASACMRKAIYELAVKEEAEGEDYESRIKSLKEKHPALDPTYFDVLTHIKDMTSDKIHEQSWDKWNSAHLRLIIETLRSILHEIYVLPDEKKHRSSLITKLMAKVKGDKKTIDIDPVAVDSEQQTEG